jgi:hypothetical protein
VGRVVTLIALCLVPLSCGGTEQKAGAGKTSAGAALAYLPADSGFVAVISTDLDSSAWDRVEKHAFPVEELARTALSEERRDVSWDEDVKPLLGNDLVVGSQSGSGLFDDASRGAEAGDDNFVGALEVSDPDKLHATLEKLGLRRTAEEHGAEIWEDSDYSEVAAVEGDVLLVGDDRDAIDLALRRRDEGGGLGEAELAKRLDGLPADAPIRVFGSLHGLGKVDELERFRDVPLLQALDSFGASLAAGDDELRADLTINTDRALAAADLPLATGSESPEVVIREHEVSAANRDQSRTTVFLLRVMRLAYPDSRFVRTVDRLERELGIDFEDEVLRQFDGPSASYVSTDGKTFAARSEVSDPAALRSVLPKLAPHLPELITGLQGLQSQGMALLFLFAPDAPLLAGGGELHDVVVHPPDTRDGLYQVTGLTGDGPSEMWFGVIGDVFVVASDEQRARGIADADTEPVKDARGASVLRADLRSLLAELGGAGFLGGNARELRVSVEASEKRLHVRVRLDVEGNRPVFPFGGN